MSPTGHKFTAAALALGWALPLYRTGLYLEAAMAAAGVMLGARAPDWAEISRWIDDRRYSLIPHRGPTHWPGTWFIGLMLSLIYLESPLREAVSGFFAAALLHLVMDVMTPTGIPLWHPFDKKRSLKVYRSGSFLAESFLTLICWAGAAVFAVVAA